MTWWIWILFGLGLMVAEVLTPGGFFVLFFGLGALLVGALAWTGMLTSEAMQWLLFSVFSVGSLLVLRPRLLGRFQDAPGADGRALATLVGDTAILTEDLGPGAVGKAELRGTSWSVRSHEPRALARGLRCTVERVDGLTLWVRPEQENH